MKILMINKYLYPKGGAEIYVLRIGEQLEQMGHQVQYFGMAHPENVVGNRVGAYTKAVDFHRISTLEKLRWGFRVIYSSEARRKLRAVLEDFQPDVCHLNNFHYQLTPSILLEIRKWSRENSRHCQIIYTAHDYQLVCPNHMCHNGKTVCEKCLGGHYGSCVIHRCIHGSFFRSLLGAVESALWHRIGIYEQIDTVLCCSEFLKAKLDTNPVLRKRTRVMHNFMEAPETRQGTGEYVLYFGRFSEEKGIRLLLRAAKELPQIPFVFAGDGPMRQEVAGLANVKNVGFQSGEALKNWIRQARFTVVPSIWYENCPFSVLESFQMGVPVLAADIGGIGELVKPGSTGSCFHPGDLESLKEGLQRMWKDPGPAVQYRGQELPAYARQLQKLYQPFGRVCIVVPVYHTAAYLDRCVKSLVNQTYRDLEILLIDDGSSDGSGELCDQWAQRDSRIRVIHKEHAGLGMARNTGIRQASADAICFVDSDDYLLPQTMERAARQLCLEKSEAVVFGLIREKGGKRNITFPRQTYRGAAVQTRFLPALLQQEGNLPISSCTALYSMELVKRLRWQFPSERDIIAEDVYALLELYIQAESVTVMEEACYVYCENPASLTRRYRPDRFEAVKKFYAACLELCGRNNCCEEIRRSCAAPFLGFVIGCMKQEAARKNREAVYRMLRDSTVQQALRENPEKPGWKKTLLFFMMAHSRVGVWVLLCLQNLLQGGNYADRP